MTSAIIVIIVILLKNKTKQNLHKYDLHLNTTCVRRVRSSVLTNLCRPKAKSDALSYAMLCYGVLNFETKINRLV